LFHFLDDGWNNLNYAVGELENPKKNLPKAAGWGVSLVMTLYILANFGYFSVVPLEEISASSELLAARFFTIVFGQVAGHKILPFFIAFSAFGAVAAMVFSASRVIYAASQARLLPGSQFLAVIDSKFQTPIRALVVNCIITIALIVGPPPGAAFDFLVEMVGYPTWIFYGLSLVGLLILRKSHAHLERPYKVFSPIAIVFILVSIFLSIFPFVPKESIEFPFYLPSLVGCIFIVSGVPVWWIFVKRQKEVNMDFDGGH
jgi:amino acid transporter